jgi:hypothetical protein
MIGEPDAGKPPVRFDEGVQETCGIVTRLCPTLRQRPLARRVWHRASHGMRGPTNTHLDRFL